MTTPHENSGWARWLRLHLGLVVVCGLGLSAALVACSDVGRAAPKKPRHRTDSVAGDWSVRCNNRVGLVIRLTVRRGRQATGRVVTAGSQTHRRYRAGETILLLKRRGKTKWVGTLLRRSGRRRKARWVPVTYVASRYELRANEKKLGCLAHLVRLDRAARP